MVCNVDKSSKAWARGARRLLEALQKGSSPKQHLALPMLILVAQQRQVIMVRVGLEHREGCVEGRGNVLRVSMLRVRKFVLWKGRVTWREEVACELLCCLFPAFCFPIKKSTSSVEAGLGGLIHSCIF